MPNYNEDQKDQSGKDQSRQGQQSGQKDQSKTGAGQNKGQDQQQKKPDMDKSR
jgi:hypothetical protein